MIQKIVGLLTILGFVIGGLLAYANTAYFPMARGVEIETKVASYEVQMNTKLDTVISLLKERN